MAEIYTAEAQPTEGGGSKFVGVRVNTGVAGEFIAVAGDNLVTEQGKRVASMRVNIPAFGTQSDAGVTVLQDGPLLARLRGFQVLFNERIALLGQALKAASAPVVLASDQIAATTTMHAATAGTGTGTPIDVAAFGSCEVQVIGAAWSGTVQWEGTINGSNWVAISATNRGTDVRAMETTLAGIYVLDCAGLKQIRANITASGGGTLTVTGHAMLSGRGDHQLVTDTRASAGVYVGANMSTAAALITAAGVSKRVLLLNNDGAAAVYLGFTTGVTTVAGNYLKKLLAGESISLEFTGAIYGITASGTSVVTGGYLT